MFLWSKADYSCKTLCIVLEGSNQRYAFSRRSSFGQVCIEYNLNSYSSRYEKHTPHISPYFYVILRYPLYQQNGIIISEVEVTFVQLNIDPKAVCGDKRVTVSSTFIFCSSRRFVNGIQSDTTLGELTSWRTILTALWRVVNNT
jgi:hypothetical protein